MSNQDLLDHYRNEPKRVQLIDFSIRCFIVRYLGVFVNQVSKSKEASGSQIKPRAVRTEISGVSARCGVRLSVYIV
jgi:hypothetical protein